jgi:cell division protein YceG involved in septum cleavage
MRHSQKRTLLPPLKPALYKSRLPMVFMSSSLAVVAVIGMFAYFATLARNTTFESMHSETATRGGVEPFPVGVDIIAKTIIEDPNAEVYLNDTAIRSLAHHTNTNYALTLLSRIPFIQHLASPRARIIVIEPGERREEVVAHFSKLLGWNEQARTRFVELVASSSPMLREGKFYPGTYVVPRNSTPEVVGPLINERFNTEILNRYDDTVASRVPLIDTLTIASLLEREAAGFEDMRIISGIIWNRLFADMKLQLDATMQYAKAEPHTRTWWPAPHPQDKDIDSPYNTYRYKGLPPSPIANPSLASVVAALNPKKTDCMFYFHDQRSNFYCTETYSEHVQQLQKYYGRGK